MSFDSHEVTERFSDIEAEFKLVQADWNQRLDRIRELVGQPRRAAIDEADTVIGEMRTNVCYSLFFFLPDMKANNVLQHGRMASEFNDNGKGLPQSVQQKVKQRLQLYLEDVRWAEDEIKRQKENRRALFGERDAPYSDDPGHGQRQQLLRGTDRLDRSTGRLHGALAMANETDAIATGTLVELQRQRETIQNTSNTLLESEGYVDRSVKTLRGMSRR